MIYQNGKARLDGIPISKIIRVTGNGVLAPNVLQYWGAIQIISQYAQLKEITTLVNATDVYATADSAGGTVPLTKTPGMALSGFEVGSFFLKDQAAASTYSDMRSDQVRMNELSASKTGQPFILNAEYGVDSFIKFHLTTTDAPVDFLMEVFFRFERLTVGSNLVFL